MKLKALILGAALSASSLLANTVTLSWNAPAVYGGGGGGEFKAVTDNHGTFLTFCLEYTVHISLNTPYSYTIDGTVLNQGDPLSNGTAELYSRFLAGSLTSPTGTYANANHAVNAGLLQQAFWMLEGEIAYNNSNFYVNLVEGIYGANTLSNSSGFYNGYAIQVMNIWAGERIDEQSQIYGTKVTRNVPDSGMTVALLGLGLLSLIAFRRKL